MSHGNGLEVTRWGAKSPQLVAAGATVVVPQFVDFKLNSPAQELTLALYALSDVPVGGLSVEWTITIGVGSTTNPEITVVPVNDIFAQTPLVLSRVGSTVQIAARIFSAAGATKLVTLIAAVAPAGPTWKTRFEGDCE